MKILRLLFTISLGIISLLCSSCEQVESKSVERPNIVILLADDLGYGDVKWTNSDSYIDTPALMKLAEGGAIATNCYSSSAMCSPSRAGLMTGKSPIKTGVHHWIKEIYKKPRTNIHLRGSEVTVAEQLKSAGYSTAMVGKWHLNNALGAGYGSDPGDQGFDYYFASAVHAEPSHRNPDNYVDNGVPVGVIGTEADPQFAAEIVADKSIEWLSSVDKSAPFFIYIPFQEAHVVCDAPDTLLQKYKDRIASNQIPLLPKTGVDGLGQAEYYGAVNSMDIAIGRIVDKLKEMGVYDNTLIIFSSDNGPDTNRICDGRLQSVGTAKPFSGRKAWILEGGIHQATLISWPKVIEAGSTIDEPISHLDIFPTLSSIANQPVDKSLSIDGKDIMPILTKQRDSLDRQLTWHFHGARVGSPRSVLRDHDWIITADWGENRFNGRFNLDDIEKIRESKLSDFRLYHLPTDSLQSKDVSKSNPEIFNRLKQLLIEDHKETIREMPDRGDFKWTPHLDSIRVARFGNIS